MRDHPHACGENLPPHRLFVDADGSPPRVWGKHIIYTETAAEAWITPTRVGKTR